MHNDKKGLDVLIRAFAAIANVHPNLDLFLVGNGPLRNKLEGLARSLALGTRIQFLGEQGRAEVAKLLHGCEVFVLPSRSEPFGIAILEALACGKPVVATTAGGIPEIIENRKNGLLVEPDDPNALAEALMTVIKDPALRLAIASNGYATVRKRFPSENTGSAYEAIFADLLCSGGNKRQDQPHGLTPLVSSPETDDKIRPSVSR
jgi:glycosyltransferase involved in cell wall biosynthesis